MIAELLEGLIEIVGQGVLEFVAECLFPDGPDKRVIIVFLFAIVGAGLGAVSLMVLPRHVLAPAQLRYLALVLVPLLTGAVAKNLHGRVRNPAKRGPAFPAFWSGWAFTFAFSLVRMCFAS